MTSNNATLTSYYSLSPPVLLGKGAFGRVVKGKELLTGRTVAVKEMLRDEPGGGSQRRMARAEAQIEEKIVTQFMISAGDEGCERIIDMIDMFEDRRGVQIVMECVECMSFNYWIIEIHAEGRPHEKRCKNIFKQLC